MEKREYDVIYTRANGMPDQGRVLRFVGTTGARDRMGDEVAVEGWQFDDYMKNPAFLWAHKYDIPPIGRTLKVSREVVDGEDSWVFDVEFAPEGKYELADQVFDLAKAGFLPATSVGFQSLDSEWIEEDKDAREAREKDTPDIRPGKKFKKKRLLELSSVPIGANPQALMLTMGMKGIGLAKEIVSEFPADAWEERADMQAKSLEALDQRPPLDNGTTDNTVETKAPLGWEPPPPAAKPTDAIADTQPPVASADNEDESGEPVQPEPGKSLEPTKGTESMAEEVKTDPTADTLKALVESVKTLGDNVSKIESRQERLVKEPAKGSFVEKRLPTDEEIAEKRKEFKAKREIPGELPPEDEFSFVRMARAQMAHDWSLAPYEKWALDETIKQKSVGWASGSTGGYWVGTQFMPDQFYMDFVAQLVARRAGIQVISCTGAPVDIPRISAGGTVYWPGQNANITENSPTPNTLQLTPKQPMARVQISKLLMQTSAGAAETYVRREIARRMALAVDYMVLRGPGTSNKPTGLIKTGSINSVSIGTNGGVLTPAHIFSMVYALEYDNVPMDGCAFVFHPRTWNTFRQTVVGADTYNYLLWQNTPNSIGVREPPQLLGYPVYTTTQLSITEAKGNSGSVCAQILFANFKECILAEWGAMGIDATDIGGNAWQQNAIEFRAVYSFDVGVRDANAVCKIVDSTS